MKCWSRSRNRRFSKTPRTSTSNSSAVFGTFASPSTVRHTLNHSWLAVSDPMRACGAIGDHQQFVVEEQAADLLLVGLELVVGAPDRRVLVHGVLEFDNRQRQPIDEDKNIRPTLVPALDDRELVDGQPIVVLGCAEIHQPDVIPGDAAVRAAVLDLHAVAEHP